MSWDAEQLANARTVNNVGVAKGVGRAGVIIGLMTAITESGLRNVDHGDGPGPSSRGLFQQMPGWGPLAVRMDPAGAAGLFYDALRATDWTSVKPWVAAQRVQQSEFELGFTGLGSDGTEGWNYLQNYSAAIVLESQIGTAGTGTPVPVPPAPPIGGTVTPEQYAALMTEIGSLATAIETARARLDTLIHAQEAQSERAILPYLQKIADALHV